MDENLEKIREEIDALDSELLKLLNRRMELAIEVGRIKLSKCIPLFHPEREALISRRLSKLNPGPLSEESLLSIYREIFAASRLIQYKLQVAFLGPEWTFSHLASISLFGHSASGRFGEYQYWRQVRRLLHWAPSVDLHIVNVQWPNLE